MAQRFDAGTLQVRGAASPVAEQVDYNLGNARAQFSAANGVLAYLAFRAGAQFQLTWFDRAGKELGKLGSPGAMNRGVISPDGKTVAVDRLQDDVFDLWLHDLERGSVSRFTFGPRANETPVWSPDGSRIAFESLRNAAGAAFQKAVAGTAQEEVLETPPGVPALATAVDDWSRDGRYVIEATGPIGKTGADVWVLRLFGDRKLFPYLQSEFNEGLARVSPDGKWLAYTSDESKRPEVYVQSFPEHGGKWQVSTNGGSHSVWSRDGKELYFVSPDGKMMAVEVQGGTNFEAGIPKSLFDAHFLDAYIFSRRWFDVSKDGKFLVPVPLEHSAAPMTVVVNWQAELKK
jgi:hypothetical protein